MQAAPALVRRRYQARPVPVLGLAGRAHVRPAAAAARPGVTPAARHEPGLVPAAGTVRRVRALMLAGWPVAILSGRLGCQPDGLRRLVTGGQQLIPGPADAATRVLYDLLWDKPGPSQRTRQLAAQRGWAPAMAWDDDTIDDPAAMPQGVRPPCRSSYGRATEVVEDAEELISWGLTPAQAAERLGISRGSLDQARRRRRRLRLAAPAPAALTSGGTR